LVLEVSAWPAPASLPTIWLGNCEIGPGIYVPRLTN
jgi:hypothetical protein